MFRWPKLFSLVSGQFIIKKNHLGHFRAFMVPKGQKLSAFFANVLVEKQPKDNREVPPEAPEGLLDL